MEQEILDKILTLRNFGYVVVEDESTNTIRITDNTTNQTIPIDLTKIKTSDEITEGFKRAENLDEPIMYKGHCYFIVDLNTSDPDTLEGVDQLLEFFHHTAWREYSPRDNENSCPVPKDESSDDRPGIDGTTFRLSLSRDWPTMDCF